MKQPPLLAILLFIVVVLGLVHTQFSEVVAAGLPLKEVVGLAVILFGSGYMLQANRKDAESQDAEAAAEDEAA